MHSSIEIVPITCQKKIENGQPTARLREVGLPICPIPGSITHALCSCALSDFAQSVVDRPGDDVHLWEGTAQMRGANTAGDEERDEDDMRWFNTMIEEDSDGHESRRACTDLEPV